MTTGAAPLKVSTLLSVKNVPVGTVTVTVSPSAGWLSVICASRAPGTEVTWMVLVSPSALTLKLVLARSTALTKNREPRWIGLPVVTCSMGQVDPTVIPLPDVAGREVGLQHVAVFIEHRHDDRLAVALGYEDHVWVALDGRGGALIPGRITRARENAPAAR